MATVGDIIRYESGEMSAIEIVHFFGRLIESGLCWKLQGSYGRMAKMLINEGLIENTGRVNKSALNEYIENNDREEEQVRLLNGED